MADKLFVSRTAVSKWESGRGYPNIESLKSLASVFNVTIDELLSGEELLTLSQQDSKKKERHFRDLVFALLDVGTAMLIFLPFFGQKADAMIQGVSLLFLTDTAPYLKACYYSVVIGIIILGLATLTLQNCERPFWLGAKSKLSLFLSIVGVLLFIVSRQPYAAIFLLIFTIIKVLMIIKW